MIISRKHRYIFLHCRKTAGSSIAVSLARNLGPDDLQLSALSETLEADIPLSARTRAIAREEARRGGIGQRLALAGLRGRERRNAALRKLVKGHFREQWNEPQPEHAYASTVAAAFPDDWARLPKFCVVRNPWTKTVSDYFWRIKTERTPPSFAEYVSALERGDPMGDIVRVRYHDNWPLYTIDNRIVVDEIIRFENLVPGLTEVCERLGIPFDGWLPRAKGQHRPKTGAKADPLSFYTPELRDTVGRLYEKEITAFGYAFDG